MIEIHPLTSLTATDLKRIASGYSSDSKYAVVYTDSETRAFIDLQLVTLEEPHIGKYDHYNDETLRHYTQVFDKGYSFAAYDGDRLIGLIIAEPHLWNHSLWVCEFHVAETYRQRGIGRQLMECAAEKARQAGLRIIVCETQNTNATAIKVYRRLGFRLEGVDISYYTNNDYPDGDIAVFMKRRL